MRGASAHFSILPTNVYTPCTPRAPCSRRGAGAAWQLACACPRHDRHLQQHRDGSPARNGPASRTPGPTCMVEQQHPDFQVSRRLPPHPAQLAERSPIADLRRRRALRAAWAWRSFVVQRGLRQHSSANGSARETGLDGASRRWRRPPRDESDGELTEPEASYAQSMKQAVGARRAAAWLPPGQPWLLLQPPTPS